MALKRTGIGVIGLALTVAGWQTARAAGASSRGPLPTVATVPGLLEKDASIWVLEPQNDPVVEDAGAPLPEQYARRGVRQQPRSVANRNRNPLNMKLGSDTRRYVEAGLATVSEIVPADGGRFLKFMSPEIGF